MINPAVQILVSPFLGTLFNLLSSLIQKEVGLVLGINKELEKLSSTLTTIRGVLDDAEVKQITDQQIRDWLKKLKGMAYDTEDLLDECALEALIPESGSNKNKSSLTSCFDFKRTAFRHTIGKRIKELRAKFDEIAEERSKYHLNLESIVRDNEYDLETSSRLPEPQVYGRDKEKESLVNLLLRNNLKDKHQGGDVSICCIVGMGGLGKTTLAQIAYNDKRIAQHFKLRCWVCVSAKFEVIKLLKAIIESSSGNTTNLENLDSLQSRLQETLSGKRFLLVLDDVWNEDQTMWHKLKSSLLCGSKGSSIIITTRLETVALLTSTRPVLHLEGLSDQDCLSLLKRRAFAVGEGEQYPNLEEIGKEIVKKCGGVPLAAKSMGSLLRFKREEYEWLSVRDSKIWDLPQDEKDSILPALRLSYNHLPSHLRQCFAYCSIFPKDYYIKKEELIRLWMANGFVGPKVGMELEDVGNEIFHDLVWRSFFQDIQKDEDGNIIRCKMHDLIHDLACSIMEDECLVVDVLSANSFGSKTTRHLSIANFGYPDSSSSSPKLKFPPLLRTLHQLEQTQQQFEQVPIQLTSLDLKCLRVLNLRRTPITTIPVSIANSKHLRYIDLSWTNITSLPESICELRNLQMLILVRCYQLKMLPREIGNMSHLRHLDIEGCYNLIGIPIGMGKLIHLQTLRFLIVGPKSNGLGGIGELQRLDHLRGELEVQGMEHVTNSTEAKNANFIRKQNLRSLSLYWSEDFQSHQQSNNSEEDEQLAVADGLQPHGNIKRLRIKCYRGVKFPSWMGFFSCLPNLVEIRLEKCRRCEHLPSLGKLPLLKSLKLIGLDSVRCLGDEFYGVDHQCFVFFPSLKKLEITHMPNLEDWSFSSSSSSKKERGVGVGGVGHGGEIQEVSVFPCLKDLTVDRCPKLRTCPPLPSSLQSLNLWGCNEMMFKRPELDQSLPHLPCLSYVSISCFDELVSFPVVKGMMLLWNLTALQTLLIRHCPKLTALPTELMKNLMSLRKLELCGCEELALLPLMQSLTSLRTFKITFCHAIQYLPEIGNRSNTSGTLTELTIQSCYRLKYLSKGLQKQTSLKILTIYDCPEIELLPNDFQHLISLQELAISGSPKLTFVPVVGLEHLEGTLKHVKVQRCSGLKMSPEWLVNHISSLRTLDIWDLCEDLLVLPEWLQDLITTLKTHEM